MHSTRETLLPAQAATRSGSAPAALPADLDGIELELAGTDGAVALLVGRIDDADADTDLLDELTEEIVAVLARVEQLRCARARLHAEALHDEARWFDYLDVA